MNPDEPGSSRIPEYLRPIRSTDPACPEWLQPFPAIPGDDRNNSMEVLQPRLHKSTVMNDEFARLKTFPSIWPADQYRKADLAKNGFYYDKQACTSFCCDIAHISLNNSNDTLESLHAQISPNCKFVNNPTTSGNIPIPETLNYNWEKHRLVTFLRTSWEAPVDPYDLAKWGFYFTGSGDVGRCFICRLEVRGWEQGDKGESEHKKWNPNCPFIQNREVGNVPLGSEATLESDAVSDAVNVNGIIHTGSEIVIPQNVLDLSQARHPNYNQRSDRMQTYTMWPMSISQRPDQLADAGFYYTGRGDRVVCFYCGGGLKDWGDGDLPWVEHAAWFSSCEYIKVMKGQEFINRAKNLRAARSQSEAQRSAQILRGDENLARVNALAPGVQLDSSRGEDASGVDESTRQLRTCKVCFLKELGIVFLPCGHMATCPDCAPQLTACPICRSKANAYVRAYLP